MKRSALLGLVCAVLVCAAMLKPTQAERRPASWRSVNWQFAPVRIMPLGDSITGSPGCWRAMLWNRLQSTGYNNVDFVGTLPPQGCGVTHDGDNEGHGGILATNMASQNQLPPWLAATNPNIVMMHLGTNDVWSNRPPATILAAFSTLVDQMRANNPSMKILVAKIIPMNPSTCPECAQRTIDFNAAIPAWASGKSTAQSPIVVVDQWTGFNTATDTYDGVHPNAAGDQRMAERWYPALTALLSVGPTPTPQASATRTSTSAPATPTRTLTSAPPSPTRTRTLTTTPAAELLANGGFELDGDGDGRPDGWGSSASIARSTAARRSGSYSLRHSSTGNVAYVASQVVGGVTAGASYSFSGWTSIPATGDAFTYRLELVWRNSANSALRTDVVRSFTAANGGTWEQASGSYVAPANSTNVVVRMNVSSLAATIYADDFSLTRGTTPPTATRTSTTQPASPTRTGSGVPASPTSTRVASPTSTSGVPPSATPTTGGPPCGPAAAITAPFTYDGTGTRCWQIATIPSYVNSWNLSSLTINGVDFTNKYATPAQLPAKINGSWYIAYSSSVAWGHFEAR